MPSLYGPVPGIEALLATWSGVMHASWLNQIEIYYSIAQRKLLEPNDFDSLAELARTLNAFEQRWNETAEPFDWNFTRDDLAAVLERLAAHEHQLQLAA